MCMDKAIDDGWLVLACALPSLKNPSLQNLCSAQAGIITPYGNNFMSKRCTECIESCQIQQMQEIASNTVQSATS